MTEEMAVNNEVVSTPETQEPVVNNDELVADNTAEPTYTKSQVAELMRRRVNRSRNAFYERYGVENREGLDELFKKAKDYEAMHDEFSKLQIANSELTREISFIKNNVDPAKYDDVITYFKGKGIDFSNDSLIEALETHQEWLKPKPQVTTISNMGVESSLKPKVDERSIASKIFGVDL